jgi:hypothetical protein
MTTSIRVLAAVAASLAAATAWVGPAAPAFGAGASASVSEVSCVDEDGAVTVTLQAGDSDETFLVLLTSPSVGGAQEVTVAAGATETVELTDLEDGEHSVEVLIEHVDADAETVATAERTVACDVAPEGPYTNVKGSVYDGCEGTGYVSASNKPIAGAVETLQPAAFEVVFLSTDDTVDGGDDPVGGGEDPSGGGEDPPADGERTTADGETVLDTFVLDAENQTYDRAFGPDELGGTGDLTLRSGGETVATAHIGLCFVLPVAAGSGGEESGPAVPDTGF